MVASALFGYRAIKGGKEGPKSDCGADGDVERVFGAGLRYLEVKATGVDDAWVNAGYFVADHQGIVCLVFRRELVERDRAIDLFEASKDIASTFELVNGRECVGAV